MWLNTALIARNLRRLARGHVEVTSLAYERYEICPAEDVPGRPAIFPQGSLDRILALSPWCDKVVERALIDGTPVHHDATAAITLRDAVLAGAFLYLREAKERIGVGGEWMLDPDLPPRRQIDEAHLVAAWMGADFFGNFMQDSLTMEMLPPPEGIHISGPVKPFRHAPGYRALFNMPAPSKGHLRIGTLTLYTDHSQNSLKVARYRKLRARLREAIGPVTPAPGIFIRRGQDGTPRQLVNEGAVIDLLAGLGFDIIDPAQMEPAEIARRALDARIVVAVEGSHLGHAIYPLADRGAFLVIQPPDRFALPYKEFADAMEMPFAFVVAAPAEGGFTADLDEIRQMLDRLS